MMSERGKSDARRNTHEVGGTSKFKRIKVGVRHIVRLVALVRKAIVVRGHRAGGVNRMTIKVAQIKRRLVFLFLVKEA